ncbi:conserved hypothetical protein [Chloroherpeton thalassium ATCC 35110]|uniref:F0F1-ATPase subunit n=1 Tax=Chloroherpeton thalassium (strain ATCC 35110 / GB-78) TaxID=517418 RepID=B3QZE6_CHLT3|nr:conserved hypothetical protein [Chloroherpeton thalassium ATCC 35110]
MVVNQGDPEQEKPKSIQSDLATAYRNLGNYIGLGTQIAASFAFFVFVGNWVDEQLHTRPLFLLVGVAMGMVGMIVLLLRTTEEANKKKNNP